MTIQEAIKSGKPFRRIGWRPIEGLWLKRAMIPDDMGHLAEYVISTQPFFPPYDDEDGFMFSVNDILADDWEVKG